MSNAQKEHRSRHGFYYAAIATLFFATSPIFIRWAAPLTSYEIATGRLLVAAIALRLLMAAKGERWYLKKGDGKQFVAFGLITALHFLFYIAALHYTSIAHALSIVYTAPIFITIFSAIFLGETIPKRKWGGALLAVVGIGILAGFQPHWSRQMLVGDLLALGSAITFGLYSIAGRSQRDHYSLLGYASTVYAAGALWMLLPAAIAFTPDAYSWRTVLSIIALGLIPMGLGHTLYNAALRRTHATYVNIIATQEVTGGVILGILLLNEIPTANEVIGAVVTLFGILLVLI